jgi:hypothetical protein
MLQPTLMAAVPVSRKEQILLLQGNLRVHKFEKKSLKWKHQVIDFPTMVHLQLHLILIKGSYFYN